MIKNSLEKIGLTKYETIILNTQENDKPAVLMKYFYIENFNETNKNSYIIDFPQVQYAVHFLIDPCKYLHTVQCVEGKLSNYYSDNYEIRSQKDLLIAWKLDNYIIKCSDDNIQFCGTFLEIHRPLNPTLIEEKEVTKNISPNYSFIYISTKKLCAGKYEV